MPRYFHELEHVLVVPQYSSCFQGGQGSRDEVRLRCLERVSPSSAGVEVDGRLSLLFCSPSKSCKSYKSWEPTVRRARRDYLNVILSSTDVRYKLLSWQTRQKLEKFTSFVIGFSGEPKFLRPHNSATHVNSHLQVWPHCLSRKALHLRGHVELGGMHELLGGRQRQVTNVLAL